MKSHQQKYEEAVQRNIKNLGKLVTKKDINGELIVTTLEEAKHRLGIRPNDTSFDEKILSALPKESKPKKEKVDVTAAKN